MKNFFQLSFTSRKTAPGKVFAKVKAYAENGAQLGVFVIKAQNEDTKGSVFVKYTPVEGSDSTACIKKLVFTTDNEKDKDKVKILLEALRSAVNKRMLSKVAEDPMILLFGEIVLTAWILPNSGTIIIPSEYNISITNELISKYAVSEWLGFEMKILPELQPLIKKYADQKRQKQAEAEDDITDVLRHFTFFNQ